MFENFQKFLCINPATCGADKSLTFESGSFVVGVFIALAITLYILKRINTKFIIQKFLIMVIGVSLFEIFTAPMWNNLHLGMLGYYYHDISWILTLGWSTLFLVTISLIDKFFRKKSEIQRFGLYILTNMVTISILEIIVLNIGIRSYAPEVIQTFLGIYLFKLPIEALYYIPVFTGLVLSFYKYFFFLWRTKLQIPVNRRWDLKGLVLTLIAVFGLEVLIHPLVANVGLPQWSYIIYDINVFILSVWILCIYFPMLLINKFLIHLSKVTKFIIQILASSFLFYQFEAILISNGIRQYGLSTTANFIGINTPLTGIPIEIAFAVIMYMVLILSFVKYWQLVLEGNYEK